MKRFIEGEVRSQSLLFPERLEDYVGKDNPVRAIEMFVESLNLGKLGFEGVEPEATGRPAYHPAVLLKIYICGYLNRIQSSRRVERETQRNVELTRQRLADSHALGIATTFSRTAPGAACCRKTAEGSVAGIRAGRL